MKNKELSITGELSAGGGLFPLGGKIAATLTQQFGTRGAAVLQPSSEAIGVEALNARLENSEELSALVARAFTASACSAVSMKKKLLARIVQRAVLDDARVDESSLLLGILERIDGPHIRCLEEIHRAEQTAKASGEMGTIARGAEKPMTSEVSAVVELYPDVVLRGLESVGLITGSTTWDGVSVIAGTTTLGESVLTDLHDVVL